MTTRATGPLALALVFLSAFVTTLVGAETDVSTRQTNNGQVVLQGVPEVPREIVDQLNRYQNVRGARFQDWSEDGESIYILTRFGNTRQLHRVGMPGGARRQITFFQEPLGGAQRRPRGSALTFSMDEGGAEFYQVFLLEPESGDVRRLTDGASRNGAVVWSRDGARLAFQSTRRNGRSNDVWLMDAGDPDTARLAFESPDGSWWGPSDFSADGKKLLLQNYVSVTDSRIHLLDLESGRQRLLAGGSEHPGVHLDAQFDAGGGGIFLLTDEGIDFTRLAHLDLETGERQIITADIDWNVEKLALSEDGSRAAFEVNENGISRLYLMNPASRQFRRVEQIPTGLMSAIKFSPDGRRLAMTLQTARSPSDVFSLELGNDTLTATRLTRWTFSEVGGLETASFATPELIHYPTFDGRSIPAFVMKPEGPGPFPVIVRIHGGPEGQYRPGFSSTYQMWVAELGAAVINPNVRGSAGYGKEYVKLDNGALREDSVKDIGALLDWITTQPDLDASRVAVYGGSYGGYMALASLMHYGDRLRAGAEIVGISSFVTFLENTQDYRRDLRRVEYGDERNPEMRAHLERISPLNNVERISAPLFVAQGQNDPRVPVTESEQIVHAVRQAGHDVWYMKALNEGHGFRKKENRDLYQQLVMIFFQRHLLPAGEAPRSAETSSPSAG